MIYTDGTHLISSENLNELHDFAINKLNFKKAWFQWHTRYPHYDLTTATAKKRAIQNGAIVINGSELIKILHSISYLRDFWVESREEYLNDLRLWLKQNNLNYDISDITVGQIGYFNIQDKEYNVTGLFMHRYFKELGFYRSFSQAEQKRKLLNNELKTKYFET
jgi:hypothetical protein